MHIYNTVEESRRARAASQGRYDREKTQQVKLKLNLKTDADILAYLESKPNMQGYIKRLIREDISRNGG